MKALLNQLKLALVSIMLFTLLFGVVYPAAIRVFALVTTSGSPEILRNSRGEPVGVSGLGQMFTDSTYFHGRPSATSYGTLPSSGSNATIVSSAFKDSVRNRSQRFASENGVSQFDVRAEMVTTSGSGLDPHISHPSAVQQLARVASARQLTATERQRLREIVDELAEKPRFRLTGLSTVNVVLLNLKLDEEFPIPR